MGGGKALSEFALSHIVSELNKRSYAFSFLAYVNGHPAGLLNCFEALSTFYCKPLINIHDIMVLTAYRGLGISHRLLDAVEALAIEKGCCKLTLEVLSENVIAKSSYQKFGFSGYELDPEAGQAVFWQKRLSPHGM